MSEASASEAERAARRLDMDWVRIGAFGLLILYHVGMFYVPWDWHVKSPRILPWLIVPMMLTSPWRLALLFLVSGAATRFMADKMGAARLAGLRTARLLVPLLFGMFVIVPPQSYLQVVQAVHYPGSFTDFYRLYVTGFHGFCKAGDCLILPTWNHLWFVAYLLIYTLLLIPVWGLARGALLAVQRGGERLLSGWGLLAWPVLGFAAAQYGLEARYPETHAVVNDWYLHAISAGPFLFGFLFAKGDGVWAAFVRFRWTALAAAAVSYGLFISIVVAHRLMHLELPKVIDPAARILYAVDQWAFIAAILGFARRHLATRDGPARRYLTEAIFPFYIIHQTTIVVCAFWLSRLGLPLALEAAILVAATAASCVLTYEIARRVGWLRPLFGLKLGRRAVAAQARTQAPRSEALAPSPDRA